VVDSVKEIKYHPENVKDLLREMKDISELMVDLAYSAVFFDDEDITAEVLRLEERMDVLLYHTRIAAMLSARKIEDAGKLSGILQIASAAEKVSNAAGDIAKIVLHSKFPDELKPILSEAEESVIGVRIEKNSPIASKTLGELKLKTVTGMRIIAIRRGTEWIYDPDKDTRVMGRDAVFARGPGEGIPILYELASGERYEKMEYKRGNVIGALEKAADLMVQMENISGLTIDLAYSSVLFYSEEIACEVELLEREMDDMKNRLMDLVLESAKHVYDVKKLRGLLHLGISSEMISDAAYEIADVVLRNIELHPVFMLAVRESDEVITLLNIEEGSEMVDRTLGELRIKTETGMDILAIRRKDGWIYHPGAKTVIESKDALVAKGAREDEELLRSKTQSCEV
jgi:uncharacterized protein with PhoU and TrkA domain